MFNFKRRYFIFLSTLLFAISLHASNEALNFTDKGDDPKRKLVAIRTTETIKLDGKLSEEAWLSANVAEDFTQLEPSPGVPSRNKTEVKFLYDDAAIYVGAVLHVENADQISKQFFERDNLDDEIETDFFGVALDTYMDGINGNGFIVGPSGGQMDVKFSSEGDDPSWDAVWQSQVTLHDKSWVVEMRIPYSALRFPDKDIQSWHIQFVRKTFKLNEEAFWNEIDPQQEGFLNQAGVLAGVENIESPVRLAAAPFLAFNAERFTDPDADPKNSWSRSFSGGMDIKYGINDAFTLDMTLVPDFGQVRSDNQVLNLSPFEVRFDENRQFFTEGTELFNKANLFYSRRVGGRPIFAGNVENQLEADERITDNPGAVQLLNATKISGRTNGGTGIGFFNAVANSTYATIEGLEGNKRKVLTNPLTNYNIMVVDQNLPNNSYISVINTNVMRNGSAYDANVTGTELQINDKDNAYYVQGSGAVSQIFNPNDTDLGFKYKIEIGKQSGNFQWEVGHNVESDTYNPNDLGIINNNNERRFWGRLDYSHYGAFGRFLRMGGGVFSQYSFLYKFPTGEVPMYRKNLYNESGTNVWWWTTTKKFLRYNLRTYFQPSESYNYFEPRTAGRFSTVPAFNNLRFNFGTDNRKKISLDLNMQLFTSAQKGRNRFGIEANPNFRFSDRFNLSYALEYSHGKKEEGFVANNEENDQIIFGRRDRIQTTNLIAANYSFNSNTTLSFRLRHNWTQVRYESFHNLNIDGSLSPSDYNENEDLNFNAFTIDAVYRWRFAPGSDIFITYKNAVFGLDDMSKIGYGENFSQLFNNPVANSISLKVLYYLDFLDVKRALRKKV